MESTTYASGIDEKPRWLDLCVMGWMDYHALPLLIGQCMALLGHKKPLKVRSYLSIASITRPRFLGQSHQNKFMQEFFFQKDET